MSLSEGSEGIWRSEKLLVMHKNAQLPDRCIKTNQPAAGKRFKATLYWHHPAIYLSILLSLLIYLIVALIVRRKAIVYVGVTEKILRRRRRAILWGWLTGIAGAILFFVSASIQSEPVMGVLMLLSLGLMLGGLIGGIARATLVGVERIDTDYIWIQGVSKEYLALLPEWKNPNII